LVIGQNSFALEVLAAQAGLHAHHAEAAQLVGAAQAQRSATANTATTIHHADYNRLFDMARGPLDEVSFAATCAAGQVLTIEQVLALAERVSTGGSVAHHTRRFGLNQNAYLRLSRRTSLVAICALGRTADSGRVAL
jgi:hypothetical protein